LHARADTSQHSKRILLVRTDRLGDVILTLPMISLLRKRFPDAWIAMLLREYTAGIVEGHRQLNEIILADRNTIPLPSSELIATLRQKNFDTAILVRPMLGMAWIIYRAGIPLRIGTGYRWYSPLFNGKVYEHRKDAKRHELEYNISLLQGLGCSLEGEPEFGITIPPGVNEKVTALFDSMGIDRTKEIIVVHPGTGGSAREWPAEYFGILAAKLQAQRGVQVLVTGSKGEERKVASVLIETKGVAIPLVGVLSLKELAAVIGRSALFISNSTGPLHIAVAMGTPVLSMFPQKLPMSAARWGPYTSRKQVLSPAADLDCSDCENRKDMPCACMMTISVEQAYDAACRLLKEFGQERVVYE
jgi:lipopolysaccharide heptosyltransferase II